MNPAAFGAIPAARTERRTHDMRIESSPRILARLVLAASIILAASSAHAQWRASDRAQATADCLPSCERSAGPQARHLCQPYCECSVRETEARYPDYKAIDDAARTQAPDTMAALKEIGDSCARRVTGR